MPEPRSDIRFDAKLIMEILNRGFNCKAKDKGKVMILDEIRENWPGDRRSYTTVDDVEKPFDRRERVQGRGGDDRRVLKDRRENAIL